MEFLDTKFWSFAFVCLYWPKTAKIALKLTSEGLKCRQEVRVAHKRCKRCKHYEWDTCTSHFGPKKID